MPRGGNRAKISPWLGVARYYVMFVEGLDTSWRWKIVAHTAVGFGDKNYCRRTSPILVEDVPIKRWVQTCPCQCHFYKLDGMVNSDFLLSFNETFNSDDPNGRLPGPDSTWCQGPCQGWEQANWNTDDSVSKEVPCPSQRKSKYCKVSKIQQCYFEDLQDCKELCKKCSHFRMSIVITRSTTKPWTSPVQQGVQRETAWVAEWEYELRGAAH